MKSRLTALAAVLLADALLVIATPLQAHHSFTLFDMTRTVTLVCTVKEFQWVNPHTWLTVVAPDSAGNLQELHFEGVPPSILVRSGWTQDTLLVGDRISLDYHPRKDNAPGGAFVAVTLPTGKRLGTSGADFTPPPPARSPQTPITSNPIQLN